MFVLDIGKSLRFTLLTVFFFQGVACIKSGFEKNLSKE